MRSLIRSKIHLATVTEADIDYVGSVAIDRLLLDSVGLWPGEKVLISSVTSGARLETYIIEAPAGSGIIGINGAAAHLIKKGEKVIIMGFELSDAPITPQVVLVDEANRVVRHLVERRGETPLRTPETTTPEETRAARPRPDAVPAPVRRIRRKGKPPGGPGRPSRS